MQSAQTAWQVEPSCSSATFTWREKCCYLQNSWADFDVIKIIWISVSRKWETTVLLFQSRFCCGHQRYHESLTGECFPTLNSEEFNQSQNYMKKAKCVQVCMFTLSQNYDEIKNNTPLNVNVLHTLSSFIKWTPEVPASKSLMLF